MPDATEPSPLKTVKETPTSINRRIAKRIVAFALATFAVWFIATIWSVVRAPVVPRSSPLVINDVSQLNPILVDQVITPTTTTEIANAVRLHRGPISIGRATFYRSCKPSFAGMMSTSSTFRFATPDRIRDHCWRGPAPKSLRSSSTTNRRRANRPEARLAFGRAS